MSDYIEKSKKTKLYLILERLEVSWGVFYVSQAALEMSFDGLGASLEVSWWVLEVSLWSWAVLRASWVILDAYWELIFIDFEMEAIAFLGGAKRLSAVFTNTPKTFRCEFRSLLRMCMCMHVCMHAYVYICKCMYMHIDVCRCM